MQNALNGLRKRTKRTTITLIPFTAQELVENLRAARWLQAATPPSEFLQHFFQKQIYHTHTLTEQLDTTLGSSGLEMQGRIWRRSQRYAHNSRQKCIWNCGHNWLGSCAWVQWKESFQGEGDEYLHHSNDEGDLSDHDSVAEEEKERPIQSYVSGFRVYKPGGSTQVLNNK